MDYKEAFEGTSYVIISTPNNYHPELNCFDTSSIEDIIRKVKSLGIDAIIVVKSTVSVGFIN